MKAGVRHLLLPLVLVVAGPLSLYAQPDSGPHSAPGDSPELVVLVHGLGRTSLSMVPMELWLERAGFQVLNFNYNSYASSIAEIALLLGDRLDEEMRDRPAPRVHFVGHSLGNIVIRWLLAHDRPGRPLGRFVMLAPPNQGSSVADRVAPFLDWLLDPLDELRTDTSTVTELPEDPGIEHLIVAGRWDGKVSIRETCLPDAKAVLVVPSGHTLIPMREDVARITELFLLDGTILPGVPVAVCP